jgi:tetratricopeptide (TPR) repeat protein
MRPNSSFRRRVGRLPGLVALLLHANAAPGQPAPIVEPAPDRQQASIQFQRGYELSQTGAFEQASRHFEAAYALEPTPTVLYNLGQAYAASGHPVEALAALRKCLQSANGELTEPLRGRVLQAARVVAARVGQLRLTVSPPGATVLLDGRHFDHTALVEPLEVKAGAHVITSQLRGFETESMVPRARPASPLPWRPCPSPAIS